MVMDKSAKEGTRTGNPNLQVSTAVKLDFESGAKTAARCSKNGEAAHTARDIVSAISTLPENSPPGLVRDLDILGTSPS